MNRREFVSTSMTATALAGASLAAPATTSEPLPGTGWSKDQIPTPALILNLDAFESNIRTMAEHCRQAKCAVRPHAKTHKCPEIARRQIAAGAIGICVATVPEAERLAAAGVTGLLLTSPVVERSKIDRLLKLAAAGTPVMLAVGHARQVELLAAAAESARQKIDVLIDLDVGSRRTGILPGAPALELAQIIGRSKHLSLRGVQAYAGHSSHVVGFDARVRSSHEAMLPAVETKQLLQQAGFDATILSGASTGTYNIDSAIDGVTELQVGSYVFMDVDYRRIGSRDGTAIYADFRPSLTVLATVVSTTHSDRVTIDAGTKALDTTTTYRPESLDRPNLIYGRGGDEFGILTSEAGETLPRLGDRLEFVVPHCDPSANLYDRLYACRKEKVEGVWPLVARRET